MTCKDFDAMCDPAKTPGEPSDTDVMACLAHMRTCRRCRQRVAVGACQYEAAVPPETLVDCKKQALKKYDQLMERAQEDPEFPRLPPEV
jgi:hypothetical protein